MQGEMAERVASSEGGYDALVGAFGGEEGVGKGIGASLADGDFFRVFRHGELGEGELVGGAAVVYKKGAGLGEGCVEESVASPHAESVGEGYGVVMNVDGVLHRVAALSPCQGCHKFDGVCAVGQIDFEVGGGAGGAVGQAPEVVFARFVGGLGVCRIQ